MAIFVCVCVCGGGCGGGGSNYLISTLNSKLKFLNGLFQIKDWTFLSSTAHSQIRPFISMELGNPAREILFIITQ